MPPPPETVVPLYAFCYDAGAIEEWTPAALPEARARCREGRVLWVNVNAPGEDGVMESLARDFGIHPLTLEDVRHTRQRPKVEDYADYIYAVGRMVKQAEDGELETEQVSILVGRGWIVTIQEGKPGDVFRPVREALRAGRPFLRAGGADRLLYALLDAMVDAYFPHVERFGAEAEALEDAMLDGRADPAGTRATLQRLRRDLLTLRRVAWPQRDAIAALERAEGWTHPETRTFLRDVSDHLSRVIDFVETNRELAASLMDLHLAATAQRTNEVMRVLTVIATIFLPLTFIAGVYGMNFDVMPELRAWWGYPAVLAVMAAVALGMLAWFRRRGWV